MRNAALIRIGLLDAMGYGNLGDAATQDSVIANIRNRLPRARIVGFSFVPEDTLRRHGIVSYPLTRHSPRNGASVEDSEGERRDWAFMIKSGTKSFPGVRALARPIARFLREGLFLARTFKTLRSLDLLIISGGGQLSDLWGGPWEHPCSLFKFSVLARLAGKRIYFLNVGAEPLKSKKSRFFVKSAVRLAHYVSLRDIESQAVVGGLGVKRESTVHPDSVYALDVSRFSSRKSNDLSCQTVGINPMGFCDPRVWPKKDQSAYEAYVKKLSRFSIWALQRGYKLTIFTTSIGVDKHAVNDLRRSVLDKFAARTTVELSHVLCESVEEVLRVIASCDFIVTSKYHGVVFSHLLAKPVVALAYQHKTEAAMRAVGYRDLCARIEDFGDDWLIDAFSSLLSRSETIKCRVASAAAGFADTLRMQFDELFLSSEGTWNRVTSKGEE